MGVDLNISLGDLFVKLHELMTDLVNDLGGVVSDNSEVAMEDIRALREHIKSRLSRGEEPYDNQKLLKLLNLFSEDKAVIEVIKDDAAEWIKLLEAIEGGIRSGGGMDDRERNEIKEINKLTREIKQMIRKG